MWINDNKKEEMVLAQQSQEFPPHLGKIGEGSPTPERRGGAVAGQIEREREREGER